MGDTRERPGVPPTGGQVPDTSHRARPIPGRTTAWRSSDVWAEDHRHARPCLSGTDADIGLTDRPSPDARRREPPVAARPRRPCTISFTVPATRANVEGAVNRAAARLGGSAYDTTPHAGPHD